MGTVHWGWVHLIPILPSVALISTQHRNKNKNQTVSMNSTLPNQYTPEQEAVIADWVARYPQGKSADLRRIQIEDPVRWGQMIQAHKASSIRAKVYYYRMNVTKDIPKKPSLEKKYVRRGPKKYFCRKCDYATDTKQSLGVHYRYQHPVDKHINRTVAAINNELPAQNEGGVTVTVPQDLIGRFIYVTATGEVRPLKLINHCPECGNSSIRHHLAAANLG